MKLPEDKIYIEDSKILNYLLVKRDIKDKSNFLNLGGYSLENWEQLKKDLYLLASENDVTVIEEGFGQSVVVGIVGILKGFGKGKSLRVKTVWQKDQGDEFYRFITLIPF
ncbi:MAG: hypothetical protein SFU98_07370 [Leptospiraceae bacterium]|nr:hypothetical protein [Leptospiraceae bacterium]